MIAIVVRKDYQPDDSKFITPSDSTQDVGFLKYKKDHAVKPHTHPAHKRVIFGTPETVLVKTGKIKYSFYNSEGKFITSEVLTEGDVVVLISGGHGQKFLEETVVLVVKQGPYLGEKDKVFIEVNKKNSSR